MDCGGCYCRRRIYSPMLKDFLGAHIDDPNGFAAPPSQFLSLAELTDILDQYDFSTVIIEGQEASLDPEFGSITRLLHERYNSQNLLLTNGLVLPDLTHVDKVEVGIKAFSDSLHREYTGVSNKPILDNLVRIFHSGKEVFVESVFIPGYINTDEIEGIAKFMAALSPDMRFVILPYFKSGLNPWRRPTPTEMEHAASVAKRHLNNVFFFRGDEQLKYDVFSAFPFTIGESLNKLTNNNFVSVGNR
jgi:pyruvate-formate lyase-activating enzyme